MKCVPWGSPWALVFQTQRRVRDFKELKEIRRQNLGRGVILSSLYSIILSPTFSIIYTELLVPSLESTTQNSVTVPKLQVGLPSKSGCMAADQKIISSFDSFYRQLSIYYQSVMKLLSLPIFKMKVLREYNKDHISFSGQSN